MEKTILNSGLTVITEKNPIIPSFALSYTVKSGSAREKIVNNGIHHMIEHMIFKGSEKYSFKEIASISDGLGGQLNAFTSKELTQVYIKAVDDKLSESFDLLTDMVFNSEFPEIEFRKELEVIRQEIGESEDNPDSFTFDLFYRNSFGAYGIGLPIAGSMESISSFSRDGVYRYYKEHYVPKNIILSCVGNVEHKKILEMALSHFKGEKILEPEFNFPAEPDFSYDFMIKKKNDLKQLYTIIGFNGVSIKDPDRYKFLIYNDILGSGMSSRLFQTIREKRGLAYTVNSFLDTYRDFGFQLIYSIMEPDKFNEYFKTVTNEIVKLKEKGIKKNELERSKDHLKSSLILNLESNLSKMRFNINQEIYFKKKKEIKDIISEVDSINIEEMNIYLSTKIEPDKLGALLYGNLEEKNVVKPAKR